MPGQELPRGWCCRALGTVIRKTWQVWPKSRIQLLIGEGHPRKTGRSATVKILMFSGGPSAKGQQGEQSY